MSITAASFRPYFAAELTAGTYHLRVGTPGVPASYVDVSIVVGAGVFWMNDIGGPEDIANRLVIALDAQAPLGGLWRYESLGVSDQTGCAGRFTHTDVEVEFDYTGSSTADDGKFPLVWVGLPNTDHSFSATAAPADWELVITQPPARTWFPKVLLNDYGRLPTPVQVTHSPITSDGSRATVVMTPIGEATPEWHVMDLDGSAGVYGGRMQRYRADKAAWATPGGWTAGTPYIALDDPGGWWAYAVRGTRFLIGDESNQEVMGPFRVSTAPENPEGSASAAFAGLRAPAVTRSGVAGGRRNIRLAFLVVEE